MAKRVFHRVPLWLAFWAALPAWGQAIVDWQGAANGAEHLSIPRYTETGHQLYAIARVDKVRTEYEKHGLFHIGALPVFVLEGFTYEIKDPIPATKNLAQLRGWLAGDKGQHIELRGVKFVVSPSHRLEAKSLTFLNDNQWELAGGVRLVSGTNEFLAPTAILDVAGPQVGQVVLKTTPPLTNTFLSVPPASNLTIVKTASK